MATYKKRGYKPKTKAEKEHFEEENSQTAEVFNTLDEKASQTEEWIIKNQKFIFTFIGIIAVLVLGYLGYNEFIAKPAQTEALNDMYPAQKHFDEAVTATDKDSLFTLSLNGADGKYGMLDIIENHSGTKAANLANYYAGVSYLNLKDYENAISYLSNFSGEDEILAPMAKGGIADAFLQLNQKEDALDYYIQAIALRKNTLTTPMYLFKAGIVALELNKPNEAANFFKEIKNNYPNSTPAKDIDLYIGKAEAMSN